MKNLQGTKTPPNLECVPEILNRLRSLDVKRPGADGRLFARLDAVVAALRIRGHAQDDRSLLEVKLVKNPLLDEVKKFLTKNAAKFSNENKREEWIKQLTELLQQHYESLKSVQ